MKILCTIGLALLFAGSSFAQSIQAMSPSSAKKGSAFPVTITGSGTNWQSTPYSYLNMMFNDPDVGGWAQSIQSPTTITGSVWVSNDAAPGFYDLTVNYTDGQGNTTSLTKNQALEVQASSITSVVDDNGDRGANFQVTINGDCTNWQSSGYAYVNFSATGVSANDVNITGQNSLTAYSGKDDVGLHNSV